MAFMLLLLGAGIGAFFIGAFAASAYSYITAPPRRELTVDMDDLLADFTVFRTQE